MEFKRITVLCGHYGSGKTNIAVNLALKLKESKDNVSVLDLDIVNPYFRTKDSADEFKKAGVKLIVSQYANSNLDIPALPDEMYSIIDDKGVSAVVDVGGDDRGALALGRLAPKIISENNYDMLMVINCYRPLTRTAQDTVEVMKEIEYACKMKFTGIINNSNLGKETTPEDVIASFDYAKKVSEITGLKIVFTSVNDELFEKVSEKAENVFPMRLQKNLVI